MSTACRPTVMKAVRSPAHPVSCEDTLSSQVLHPTRRVASKQERAAGCRRSLGLVWIPYRRNGDGKCVMGRTHQWRFHEPSPFVWFGTGQRDLGSTMDLLDCAPSGSDSWCINISIDSRAFQGKSQHALLIEMITSNLNDTNATNSPTDQRALEDSLIHELARAMALSQTDKIRSLIRLSFGRAARRFSRLAFGLNTVKFNHPALPTKSSIPSS